MNKKSNYTIKVVHFVSAAKLGPHNLTLANDENFDICLEGSFVKLVNKSTSKMFLIPMTNITTLAVE